MSERVMTQILSKIMVSLPFVLVGIIMVEGENVLVSFLVIVLLYTIGYLLMDWLL